MNIARAYIKTKSPTVVTMKEIATPPSGEVVVKTLEFSESARTSDQVQIAVTVDEQIDETEVSEKDLKSGD